jgi:hypothetical protein
VRQSLRSLGGAEDAAAPVRDAAIAQIRAVLQVHVNAAIGRDNTAAVTVRDAALAAADEAYAQVTSTTSLWTGPVLRVEAADAVVTPSDPTEE